MAENSKIEWCDHTASPWHGCSKVSAGCDNCYAAAMSGRNPGVLGVWGDDGVRVKSKSFVSNLRLWNKQAAKDGRNVKVFPSLCDPFEDRPELIPWREEMFQVVDECPNVILLLLTKRPENIRKMWPSIGWPESGVPGTLGRHLRLENVWLLTSVENQEQADKRIYELLKCRDLSPVLGLSCEPLLGPVDLTVGVKDYINGLNVYSKPTLPKNYLDELDWIIVGGESGPNARPIHPDWARSLRDQCRTASVPFFFKQWGEWAPAAREYGIVGHVMPDTGETSDGTKACWIGWDGTTKFPSANDLDEPVMAIAKVGKKRAGRILDGREWNEVPE